MATDDGSLITVPEPLGRAATYAAPEATCDVVMKGGITSGIVYPWTVCDLAGRYRLVNVGGTSAGAIAAAAAAAAEYGRLTSTGGFPVLAALPARLGTIEGGQSRLFRLFQAQRSTAPLYALLAASVGGGGGGSRVSSALRGVRAALSVPGGWWRVVLGAVVGVVLLIAAGGYAAGWALLALVLGAVLAAIAGRLVRSPVLGVVMVLAAVVGGALASGRPADTVVAAVGWLLLVVGVCVGAGSVLVRVLVQDVPENFYGMCTGMPAEGSTSPALTPWLADVLDEAAGLAPTEPLTFGHLWAGPGVEPLTGTGRPPAPAINLEVMTTCLTRSRPYRIPFVDDDLYVDAAELRRLFPDRVVDWMLDHPSPRTGSPSQVRRKLVVDALMAPLVPFPAPADLPVVVAARMSLSFPGLISAVPLHALDRVTNADGLDRVRLLLQELGGAADPLEDTALVEAVVERARADGLRLRADRLWFSDGGITSNFPIHFFDSFAPTRPTFGLNLRPHHPAHPPTPGDECSAVYLPTDNLGGRNQAPNLFDAHGPSLFGFLNAILDTMQNWNDLVQLPLPGFRDRIAHVGLARTEGGMNLAMPPERIAALAARGRCAGMKLRQHFSQPGPGGWTGWENHRWLRLRSNLALLEGAAGQVERAMGPAGAHPDGAHSFSELVELPVPEAPSYPWANQTQRTRAIGAVEAMRGLAPPDEPTHQLLAGVPRPLPSLRITPKE